MAAGAYPVYPLLCYGIESVWLRLSSISPDFLKEFDVPHYFAAPQQKPLEIPRENPYIWSHVRYQRLAQGILGRRPGNAAPGHGASP